MRPWCRRCSALQDAGSRGLGSPGCACSASGSGLETTKFDLMLAMMGHARGLRAVLTYSTDLFERATAERMLAHLARVLEQVAIDPEIQLGRADAAGR